MARAGINREITTVRPAIADGRKLIETEEEIVRLSEQCLDVASYSEFAAAQDEVWRTDERHSTHDRAAAASFRDLVVEVLGGQTSKLKPGDPSLTRLMVTMTPILRAEILFPPVTSADAPISPARATRMLSVIDLVAEFARASGMAAMTYHTITRLFHDFKPLLELLSMLDHEVAFRDGDRIRWPFPGPESSARRYLSLVRGILKSGRPGHERALGELLGTPTSGELLERVAYLKGVARCFTGILVPASSGSRVRRMGWHHHSRAAFQRWMVINLPDDRILRVRH